MRPSIESFTEARRRSSGRCRGTRVRQVIVDVPAHACHLLIDGIGDLPLTGVSRGRSLVAEYRQRCLEAVREIARLGDGAVDRTLPMIEQRVEIVDERCTSAGNAPSIRVRGRRAGRQAAHADDRPTPGRVWRESARR
jgi:hypothetical protein